MSEPSSRLLILRPDNDRERWAGTLDKLTHAGYAVETVRDYAEAMDRVSSNGTAPPEVVILDTVPSTSDGLSVCAAVKSNTMTQTLPVLCVFHPGLPGAREEAFGAGADDLISEPIDNVLLLARIRSLIRGKKQCDEMAEDLQRLTQIGIGLSSEHKLDRLLERILDEARSINNADAGTLYTVDADQLVLHFEIAQNETLGIRMGGTSNNPIPYPPVPITRDNVSGYVALTGEVVNILDVYEAEGFDFSGPRKYDAITGYRSRSMLVVPMKNHDDQVIGVLQLINARKPGTFRVGPFLDANVDRTLALASQAGVAITNTQLISDLKEFLEGLIAVMADAIDEKSPYTAGHIQRVTKLAGHLAEAVNQKPEVAGGCTFSADELNELRIAGLLHDIGKIVIPEHIIDKATKLETLHDRIALVRARFALIRSRLESAALRRKLALVQGGAAQAELRQVDEELEAFGKSLEDDLAFIESCNTGGEFMAPERLERLRQIAACTYLDEHGKEHPYLTENEVENLSIARGTLLPREIDVIRSHAAVGIRLLDRIPFSRKLRNVPIYAGDHHEMLNGSGYPQKKTADQLPTQSRILAIADIFDALTASDRPYKKAFPVEVAYKILREDAERGKLDAGLVELFIESQCYARLQAESAESAPKGEEQAA